jgi:hypothetical protein
MSIFGKILDKLGIKKPEEPKAQAKPVVSGKAVGSPPIGHPQAGPTATGRPTPVVPGRPVIQAKPAEMPLVDVMGKLEAMAKASPIQGLNWKQSINDLMALLGIDHKPEDIKALAVELGCPESEMGDSYKRNVWTHKALLKKIAENGGNIPASLLD